MKKFTLVSTVFNEGGRLQESIDDIEGQTLKPNEIVIIDAGSKDNTLEILNKWKDSSRIKIEILIKQKCNVAEGRNLAIKESTCDLILSTDFGCRFDCKWMEKMIAPFDNEKVDVVGGNFSVNEAEIKTVAARAAYILAKGYNNKLDSSFVPSSRSIAYYKKVWKAVGKYPEQLTLAGDDTLFGMKIIKKGFYMELIEEPLVFWGRHSTFESYNKEAFRYGLGDGETKDSVNRRNFVIKSSELILRLSFITVLILLFFNIVRLNEISVVLIILMGAGFRPYLNTTGSWIRLMSKKYNFFIFLTALVMMETTRWNYIKAYIKGAKK